MTAATGGLGRGWAAGLHRPHRWPCRHCGMVEDYHLLRDAQLRAKESLSRRDEIDRLVVFKDWLRAYEWPSQRPDLDTDTSGDDGAHRAVAGAAEGVGAIPAQRDGADPVERARQAVDAVPGPVDRHEPDVSLGARAAAERVGGEERGWSR